MHRCLITRVELQVPRNGYFRWLPGKDGDFLTLVEVNGLVHWEFATEDFAKTFLSDKYFDMTLDSIDSEFLARLQCVVECWVRHVDFCRHYFLVCVRHTSRLLFNKTNKS